MKIEEVERMVLQWAEDRDIFKQSRLPDQYRKLYEEFMELGVALKVSYSPETKMLVTDNTINASDSIDAVGDMMVVLTLIAHQLGVTLFECYARAYIEIKDRKGKMVNGLFVKET